MMLQDNCVIPAQELQSNGPHDAQPGGQPDAPVQSFNLASVRGGRRLAGSLCPDSHVSDYR